MLPNPLDSLRHLRDEIALPAAARRERARDRAGPPKADPGPRAVIDAAVAWLGRAQDNSASADGGVARHYSLIDGWAASYPETTGYIVPTMLEQAAANGDDAVRVRGLRMLDWLVSIQFPEGGFQGGMIGARPAVPVTFNTGQILLGLAAGAALDDAYLEPMRRAADWLVATQDPDGCWRRHSTPFAEPGEKAYETHVAWSLVEAARVDPDRGYAEAALANTRWAITKQRANGWFEDCCLSDPSRPLTHTLGYALRGVLEVHRYTDQPGLLDAARRLADGLITCLGAGGRLPGRLDHDWRAAVDWVCLTGSAQIAHCWLLLHGITGESGYRDAGLAANAYVRRTIRLDGPAATNGAVKGSFPVDGQYGRYEYLNWAAKFMIDANRLEQEIARA